MNARSGLLACALLSVIGAGVAWYAWTAPDAGMPPAADETTFDPTSSPAPPQARALPSPSPTEASRSFDSSVEAVTAGPEGEAVHASPDDAAPVAAATAPDAAEQAADELMREMAATTYREQGSPYVDYLLSNGLARTDAERLIERGFRDAVGCSVAAMRGQAEAEGVPFDTVLYAVAAMFHQGDGPLLRGVIDMDAVRAEIAKQQTGDAAAPTA